MCKPYMAVGRKKGRWIFEMYESYEALMEKKLAMIDDRRDKRQGSVIYDAMAPNAAETATFYSELEMLENRTFADTATGMDLTKRCKERGILRKAAVKATFYGTFTNKDGEIYALKSGERFFLEEYYYQVLFLEEDGKRYVLECETAGECGNSYLGTLLPVSHLEGLAKATLTELRTDGEDEESDEALRKRYMQSFSADAFGGNVADYKQKVGAMQNVGGVKVEPVWQGGGTVKLVIIDQGFKAPSTEELKQLQNQIDPQTKGLGEGIAPIGHKVTVVGVTEVGCTIKMDITWHKDADQEQAKLEIKQKIEAYLLELRKGWADTTYVVVRSSYLEAAVLYVAGVLDVQNCTINQQSGNLQLQHYEIPILKTVEVV